MMHNYFVSQIAERAAGKPIYVTSPIFVKPIHTDEMLDLLGRKCPGAIFVNSRGRYKSTDDWRKRWAVERDNYGAGVILTVGEPTDDDPHLEGKDGIAVGAHVIGAGVWQELYDLTTQGKPVLWMPYWPWQYRFVACFAVEPLNPFTTSRFGELLPATDATSYRPTFGSHLVARE
jgi:hypothetical protein